jgi:hypothetical protein
MLTILGGLAEFERPLTKARTGAGRERGKGRGMRFGRALKLSPHQRRARRSSGWTPVPLSWMLPGAYECGRRRPSRQKTWAIVEAPSSAPLSLALRIIPLNRMGGRDEPGPFIDNHDISLSGRRALSGGAITILEALALVRGPVLFQSPRFSCASRAIRCCSRSEEPVRSFHDFD